MTDVFVFPSDMDRADNEELDRVCTYLEELLDKHANLKHHAAKVCAVCEKASHWPDTPGELIALTDAIRELEDEL